MINPDCVTVSLITQFQLSHTFLFLHIACETHFHPAHDRRVGGCPEGGGQTDPGGREGRREEAEKGRRSEREITKRRKKEKGLLRLLLGNVTLLYVLGTGSHHLPPERQLDELRQVAGHLDGANVGRVPLRADVVVLQDALGAEVVHEGVARLVEGDQLLRHAVPDRRR